MTEFTRIHDRFSYHVEDLDCHDCQFYVRMNNKTKTGCGNEICRFEDIRREAVENGRLKRPRGWFKSQE